MSKYWKVLAIGIVGAFALAQPTFAAGGGDDNHGPKGYTGTYDGEGRWDKECADDDSSDDTIDFVGATNNWPPNHREVTATVFARGDEATDDGDPNTPEQPADTAAITSVIVTSNDSGFVPSGDDADWGTANPVASTDGTASTEVWTVRERSGDMKDTGGTPGRIYNIAVTATFSDSADPCTATFCVRTPHDMRGANRDWEPCQTSYDTAEETEAES
jgi:hypothetical protein